MSKKSRGIRRHLVPIVVIMVGISFSCAGFYLARKWEDQKVREAFRTKVEERNAALEREIEINLLVLASLQAYAAHAPFDRRSFRDFVLPLLQRHPSIEALEYIPRVPDRLREEWERRGRLEGFPEYRLTERVAGKMATASRREEYFPVFSIEPVAPNRFAMGYDLASNPQRKEALERARDTGALVATGPISLVQAKNGASGVLIFAPLYRNLGSAPSVEERRRKLAGFALGVFYHGDIVERALGHFRAEGIDVTLYDEGADRKPIFFHPSRKGVSAAEPAQGVANGPDAAVEITKGVDVAGRKWLVRYRATPSFTAGLEDGSPLILLATGLLLTAALGNYLVALIRRAEVVGELVEAGTRALRQEIAERSKAEQELQKAHDELERRVAERTAAFMESEDRYRRLFHSNPQPMWVYELETLAFLDVNEAALKAYGYSREEFLSMTIKEIRPAEDVPELMAKVRTLELGLRSYGTWRHLKKDGSILYVDISLSRFEFGGREAQLALAHDVTAKLKADEEKEALETQLRQSQKMEAVGTLAGGIAHDFNNILTAIVGYGTLLQLKLPKEGEQFGQVQRILEASERAANLTKSLLAYSRKQISKPRPVDLDGIVKGLILMLRGMIPESIEFVTELSGEELTVMADPGQIEQVLMNLASNARDAMPEGGRLRILSERMELDDEFIRIQGYGQPGSFAALRITDTGSGMDRATCDRIFEPFFTTKEVGKGTGLGLSTAYGIIKQHQGYINVDSTTGAGTTFTIYLPLTDQAAVASPAALLPVPVKGMETILLVEDDPEIRKPIKELLQVEGYTVHEAVDGQDGVRKFLERQEEIQLVILDMVMPKMSGKAVYEEIRKVRPETRALFISGYSEEMFNRQEALPAALTLVTKPLNIHNFLCTIRAVLGQERLEEIKEVA